MTTPSLVTETKPYHKGTLYTTLSDIRQYLAELQYIDAATAYLEEQRARAWDRTPLGTTFGLEVTLGETVPFTRWYEIPGGALDATSGGLLWESRRDEILGHIQALRSEAATWAANDMETLEGILEEITYPSVSLLRNLVVEPLISAHKVLQIDINPDFGSLDATLGVWEGDAARNFRDNFYKPFKEQGLENQRMMLGALAGAAAAATSILDAAQHSLMNVVHYLREELYAQLELRSQGTVRPSDVAVLILGGTILGTLLTGGGLWSLGIGLAVNLYNMAASDLLDKGRASQELAGQTAEDFAKALLQAVREIKKNMGGMYGDLERQADEALSMVDHLLSGKGGNEAALLPLEVTFLDDVDSGEFRHETGSP